MKKGGCWIGVDLGGTRVRAVLSDGKGNFLEKSNEPVEKKTVDSISKQIVRLAHSLCSRRNLTVSAVKGLGIASAGPLIMAEGALVNPPNLPFHYIPLVAPIKCALDIPVCLLNDCAAAALGEKEFGAARGLENFAYLTISTGIGCGAIVNGTLLLGKDGNGHEVGHFVIDCEGRLICGCGRPGHWEAYCSGRNMPNYVRMRFKDMDEKTTRESLLVKKVNGDLSKLGAEDLFRAAEESDAVSTELVKEIGVLNAIGFANVINAYDPSLITVGGTVTLKNRKVILDPIQKHVEDYAINRVPRIRITQLGEDVCLYGAVAAAIEYLS